jgi:hypothetical protein
MEASIGDCLATLGKYETQFAKVLQQQAAKPVAVPTTPVSSTIWDEKLHDAEKQAADVAQLLAEQEAVWGKWQQTFANWQQMLNDAPHAITQVSGHSGMAKT